MSVHSRPTQRDVVLAVLRSRGSAGVSAIELDREHHVYRAAARVSELRDMGYRIETKQRHGMTAVYTLVEEQPTHVSCPACSYRIPRTAATPTLSPSAVTFRCPAHGQVVARVAA